MRRILLLTAAAAVAFAASENDARLVAAAKLDIGFEPHRVGAVYAMLKWVFMDPAEAIAWMDIRKLAPDVPLPPDPHLKDSDLQPASVFALHEIVGADWGDDSDHFLLEPVHTRAEALRAIGLITEQGEGFDSAADSHFNGFLKLVEAFETKPFGRPIATSPTLTPGHGGEKPTPIAAPYTKLWAEVQSLHYTMLIVGMLHGFSTPRDADGSARRLALATFSIGGMRELLRPLSEIVTGLPLAPGSATMAGPTFDCDPAQFETGSVTEYAKRQIDVLARLQLLYAQIEASPEFDPTSQSEPDCLTALRDQDETRRVLMETQLATS